MPFSTVTKRPRRMTNLVRSTTWWVASMIRLLCETGGGGPGQIVGSYTNAHTHTHTHTENYSGTQKNDHTQSRRLPSPNEQVSRQARKQATKKDNRIRKNQTKSGAPPQSPRWRTEPVGWRRRHAARLPYDSRGRSYEMVQFWICEMPALHCMNRVLVHTSTWHCHSRRNPNTDDKTNKTQRTKKGGGQKTLGKTRSEGLQRGFVCVGKDKRKEGKEGKENDETPKMRETEQDFLRHEQTGEMSKKMYQ